MTKQQRLYGIRRQLDLLGYRADRLNPGPRRDTLIAKMERLLTQFALVSASYPLTARAAPSRCGSSPSAAKRKTLRPRTLKAWSRGRFPAPSSVPFAQE